MRYMSTDYLNLENTRVDVKVEPHQVFIPHQPLSANWDRGDLVVL
jgi:hypothetical protein